MTSISHRLMYRTVEYVPARTMEVYKKKLQNIVRIYKRAEFNIRTIRADNEFVTLQSHVNDEHHATLNIASANEHVPHVEWSIRGIKKRARAIYNTLPFVRIPKIMVKYLVSDVTKKLNMFPNRHGISSTYSPREILHHRNSYVQAHDEPTPLNSQRARTMDCIYLTSLSNVQGGMELLDLHTGRIITRRRVTVVPMTQQVIDRVEDLARNDEMRGLKITTSLTGVEMADDTAWPAGVEMDNEPLQDNESVQSDEEVDNDQYLDELLADNDDPSPIDENDKEHHDAAEIEDLPAPIDEDSDTDAGQNEPSDDEFQDAIDDAATTDDNNRQTRSTRGVLPSRFADFQLVNAIDTQKTSYETKEARTMATIMCQTNIGGIIRDDLQFKNRNSQIWATIRNATVT